MPEIIPKQDRFCKRRRLLHGGPDRKNTRILGDISAHHHLPAEELVRELDL